MAMVSPGCNVLINRHIWDFSCATRTLVLFVSMRCACYVVLSLSVSFSPNLVHVRCIALITTRYLCYAVVVAVAMTGQD